MMPIAVPGPKMLCQNLRQLSKNPSSRTFRDWQRLRYRSAKVIVVLTMMLTPAAEAQTKQADTTQAAPLRKPAQTVLIDAACPGSGSLAQAEDCFRQRRIKEAAAYFKDAIEQSAASGDRGLAPLSLASANHALGHCLDYLWQEDHGEKYFANATKIYEKIDWPGIPILGIGKEGNAMLDEITRGGINAARAFQNRLDWSVILTTNYDWAEALYRNKHYEEAVGAYKKFLTRQNGAHLVAMCSMSNRLNGTYLGQPTRKHMVDACLHAFDKDADPQLLKDSLSTIANSKLSSTGQFFQSLDQVRLQAEDYFLAGKKKQALVLLDTIEAALKDFLAHPNHNLEGAYGKAYPAMIQHMKSAGASTKLYASLEVPGSKDAEEAESAYCSRKYEKAIEMYLGLLKSHPTYEIALFEQAGGVIGAPISRHLVNSCLHIFDEDEKRGADLLERMSQCIAPPALLGHDESFFDPLETRAEDYFYAGQFQRSRILFELERKFAGASAMQGLAQAYSARAADYLNRISRLEKSR